MPDPSDTTSNTPPSEPAVDLEILDDEQSLQGVERHISEIVRAHRDVVDGISIALQRSLEVGLHFTCLKAACSHGAFGAQVERTGIPMRTAQHYMKVTRDRLKALEETKSAKFALLPPEKLLEKLPTLWGNASFKEDFRTTLKGRDLALTAENLEVTKPRSTPTARATSSLASKPQPVRSDYAAKWVDNTLIQLKPFEASLPHIPSEKYEALRERICEIGSLLDQEDAP